MKKFLLLLCILVSSCDAKTPTKTLKPNYATVSWIAPSTYTDGSPIQLSQIKNFNIYYGKQNGGPYSNLITVGGSLNKVVITIPSTGTWYFVATTVDTDGKESSYSNQGSKTF
jgi:hypothetical protein